MFPEPNQVEKYEQDLNVHFEMDSTRDDDMSWYGKRWIKVFKAIEDLELVQFNPDNYEQ